MSIKKKIGAEGLVEPNDFFIDSYANHMNAHPGGKRTCVLNSGFSANSEKENTHACLQTC